MITRREFLAHLVATGAYAQAANATPRFLFATSAAAVPDDALVEPGLLQTVPADQTWRTLALSGPNSVDISAGQDILLQFGDSLVGRDASPSTAIYYPAAGFGGEPVGVPSGATHLAIRAVETSGPVEVLGLSTVLRYGGTKVALSLDGLTRFSMSLPASLQPPLSVFFRFRTQVTGQVDHVVSMGVWGQAVPQRSLRTVGTNRMQVHESTSTGGQSSALFDNWVHRVTQGPLWSVVGGSWRPAGTPGKGRYAHNAATELFSLADLSDPVGTKAAQLPDLIVGGDARGGFEFPGTLDWIWIVGHELTQSEWEALKRINIDTSVWPPDLVGDTVAFFPVQANAPLVDVISGEQLTLRQGTLATRGDIGPNRLQLPGRVGASITIPYGDVASAPVALPVPNKGVWRAQTHHDVRVAIGAGGLATGSSRLLATGSGVTLLHGTGPSISVIANTPGEAGALNLTALI